MRKKLWIAVILLAAGLVSQWLTVNAFSDNFREKAEQHLQEILPGNIFWEWKNPKDYKRNTILWCRWYKSELHWIQNILW